MKNTIIYLIGNPGIGKQTIAKKIAAREEFTIVDNHSYTNAIFAISSDFTNPKHEYYRLQVRDVVYNAITDLCPAEQSFIFTNVIYRGEENICIQPLQKLAEKRNALFIPVWLQCSKDENKRRIKNPFRAEQHKTRDAAVLDTIPQPTIDLPNLMTLDTTYLSADASAQIIIEHAKNIERQKKCVLCQGLQDEFQNINRQYPELSENVVLFETPSFKVIPDKFPIAPNHIIILPKKHINTFAEFSSVQGQEIGYILNRLQQKTKAQNFIMFEHGTSQKEELNTPAHIKSIFHAHLHFIPDVTCDTSDLITFFNNKNITLIDTDGKVRDIKDFETSYPGNQQLTDFIRSNVIYEEDNQNSVESYFYIKNSDNTQLFIPERLVCPQIPSQFLREALSEQCNTPEWNWKNALSEDGRAKYARRILQMKKLFKEPSAFENILIFNKQNGKKI